MASMEASCASSLASTAGSAGGSGPGSIVGQPPVIYARVDHAAKRNNNLCMLNQAQTTVPLLISNSSVVSSGGGVSPSSIMNTSCESSTSSGSASRCTRIHNPDYGIHGGHGGHDLNGRHSSSADEGFTSGSSPVNGLTSGPMVLSPQSSGDTTHLVELSQTMTSKEPGNSSNIGSGNGSRNIHPTNLRFSTTKPQKF